MDPEKWRLVKEHFEGALSLDVAQREAFLREACGEDAELYNEVISLLEADGAQSSLLDQSPSDFIPGLESQVAIGKRIAQYDIISQIGSGGMGDVYLALDTKLKRKVALKFLHPHLASLDAVRARFMREARAAAVLSHPSIVTIYEVSESVGRPFIAMEFVEGVTLRELISSESLDLNQILKISIELCSALSKAHQRLIIHRDIKPENIKLNDEMFPKILDFGIAKTQEESQLTAPGAPLGTANYMSPEQARGDNVDHRTDIFSLGVVLHEMLAGKPPFDHDDFAGTIRAVVSEPAPLLRSDRLDIPPTMQAIVDKAMMKDLDERYQSMEELTVELKRIRALFVGHADGHHSEIDRTGTTRSIAVLHLQNLGDADDEYLCYGLTEDLIVDLARIRSLRVAPLRSVLAFKGKPISLESIADKLGIEYVLDGSILKTGQSIRVTVQLVDVSKNEHVWVERREESYDNLTKVKKALTVGIIRSLGLDPSSLTSLRIGGAGTDNPQAYEYYLRAKYTFDHKKDTQDLEVALGLYQRALKLDSSLISARAGAAEVLIHQGKLDPAHSELETALDLARSASMEVEEGSVLRLLSDYHAAQSRWDIALKLSREAVELLRQAGDVDGEAHALSSQISILLNQAQFDDAIAAYDRVVEINRLLNDEEKVAEALKNMGKVYRQKANYDKAEELYEEALTLARRQGNLALESACLGNLGNVHLCRSNLDAALSYYSQALEIDSRLDNKSSLQAWHTNVAYILKSRDDFRDSLEHIEEAVRISRSLGDKRVYVHALTSKCEIFLELGEFEGAVGSATEALRISESIEYKQGISAACLDLGSALMWAEGSASAKTNFERALNVAKEAGLRRNEAWAHQYLGELLFNSGEPLECRNHFESSLRIAIDIEESSLMFRAKAYIIASSAHIENSTNAVPKLRRLLSEHKHKLDLRHSLLVRRLMGQILAQYGETNDERVEGRKLLREVLDAGERKGLIMEIKLARALLK